MIYKCKYCSGDKKNSNSLRNHERLCKSNPDRRLHQVKGHVAWNKGLTKYTSIKVAEGSKKSSLVMKQMFAEGKLKPSGAALWSKEEHSNHAKLHCFGGYREGAGRSKKFYVNDSNGDTVCLQSSYEYEVYQILTEQNIFWKKIFR